jgi:hypothetical protein
MAKPKNQPKPSADAAPVQGRCTALDQDSSPAQRCELDAGHTGQHEWTIQGAWPANMQKPEKKKFKAER